MDFLKKQADKVQKHAEKAQDSIVSGVVKASGDIQEKVINPTIVSLRGATLRKLVVDKLGYPLEKHVYRTKDGYINTLYRIPGPRGTHPGEDKIKTSGGDPKPVALYQHGLCDSCVGCLCDEENSLGIRLVNEGYDLWMNNSRGNRYSRDHSYLDPDERGPETSGEFWKFSFHELAIYDQPAAWEYIQNYTGVKKISYIGHSQGTTQMFAALSDIPDFFKDRMQCFIAIAPAARCGKLTAPRINKMKHDKNAFKAFELMGPEMFPISSAGDVVRGAFATSQVGDILGSASLKEVSDVDPDLVSKVGMQNYGRFYPAGGAFQQFHHYQQLMTNEDGEFRKYDHGSAEANLAKHGSETPPLYNLDNINGFNITMICGKGDHMASPGDYTWLREALSPNNDLSFFEYEEGHTALLMPKNHQITDDIIRQVKKSAETW